MVCKIEIPDMSSTPKVGFQTTIDDNTYTFEISWNYYTDCAICNIYNSDNDTIVNGWALVTNSIYKGDLREIPILYFANVNDDYVEPDTSNINTDFGIYYE